MPFVTVVVRKLTFQWNPLITMPLFVLLGCQVDFTNMEWNWKTSTEMVFQEGYQWQRFDTISPISIDLNGLPIWLNMLESHNDEPRWSFFQTKLRWFSSQTIIDDSSFWRAKGPATQTKRQEKFNWNERVVCLVRFKWFITLSVCSQFTLLKMQIL